METAVSFLMDGRPVIGEQVAVVGQGVVGLLTTALLSDLPLSFLLATDPFPLRREWAIQLGATAAPAPDDAAEVWRSLQGGQTDTGADLTYEVSGNPRALNLAIALTGDYGRVVIGSWSDTLHIAYINAPTHYYWRPTPAPFRYAELSARCGRAWECNRCRRDRSE